MNDTPVKRRRTQTERRDEAEEKLMAAAIELIAEKGFRGLVLGEVGLRAGYSNALPVHYFKTKEALILRVARRIVGGYSRALQARVDAGEQGLGALRTYVRTYLRYAHERRVERRALFMITSEAAVHEPLREEIAAISRGGIASLARIIREGQVLGEIDTSIDADVHAALLFASLRGVVSLWAVDAEVDLERLAVALEALAVSSLQPRAAT